MTRNSLPTSFIKEIDACENLQIFGTFPDRKRYSRDFYDYSPILMRLLNDCCADLVVRPSSIEAVMLVASACNRYRIPLTLRGSGTGNYGQCVPLEGGVVMLMNAINQIRNFDLTTGDVVVEPGCLLANLDNYLLKRGRQLKLLPSTWRTASVGGFIAGGSGGIGSVSWGFLRDPGHLLGLEVVTIESSPKKLQLDSDFSKPLNHAYGTNGIITALRLSTASSVTWHEVIIDCKEWFKAVQLLQNCATACKTLFLCTLLERRIIENLPTWSGESNGNHRLLLLVGSDEISKLEEQSQTFGADFSYLGVEKTSNGNGLRELSWNHTTLHMRSKDPNWTYLQMLLPQPEIGAMNDLSKKWNDSILWHLEVVRQEGVHRIAALPIVRWVNENVLEELMNDCSAIGAVLFNPHVVTVEDGGLGVVDVDQVNAKKKYDPNGLLNPGKLKGWN